jgi:FkbM family methyltransferase
MQTSSFDLGYISSCFDFGAFSSALDLLFKNDGKWLDWDEKGHRYPAFLKLCILQRYFDLNDNDLYNSVAERKSFLEFLDIHGTDELPEIRSLIYFKKKATEGNVLCAFFAGLDQALAGAGVVIHRGRTRNPRIIPITGYRDRPVADEPKEDLISEMYFGGIPYPMRLRSNTSDVKVFEEVFLHKTYDLKLDIKPKFILDCGANIGLSSIFLKSRFPDSFIVAVEPEVSNYMLAEHNLSYYYPSIECIKAAIWHRTSRLRIQNKNSGKWAFRVEECSADEEGGIEAVTIGQIMRRYKRGSIDILKIDIEGAESELFSGNYEEWLPNAKLIMIELHDHIRKGSSKPFFSALSRHDFSVSVRENILLCVRD